MLLEKNKTIEKLKKEKSKYQMRYQRTKKELTKFKLETLTPEIQAQRILESGCSSEVQTAIVEGLIMKDQLTENYSKLKRHKQKQMFCKILAGKIIKKI